MKTSSAARSPSFNQGGVKSLLSRRLGLRLRIRKILLISYGFLFFSIAICDAAEVVLWNKMGSAAEITQSEIGPGGILSGGNYAFESGKFGKGYVRKALRNWVEFPGTVLSALSQRGTVEMWITPKVTQPQPYNYGIFGFLGHPYSGQVESIAIYWGDGVSGQGLFGGFASQGVFTPTERNQFVASIGVPFYVALSWDITGIDGGGDTIRVYRDGAIIGATRSKWDPAKVPASGFTIGTQAESDGNSYDKYVTDNLIVWDFAKTDFSNRFVETPNFSCDTVPPRLSASIANKTGNQANRIWTVSITNKSPCPATNVQITGLAFAQTYGPTCNPTMTFPAGFPPLGLGNISSGGKASGNVGIDFSGCANTARFSATLSYKATETASTGSVTLKNQYR